MGLVLHRLADGLRLRGVFAGVSDGKFDLLGSQQSTPFSKNFVLRMTSRVHHFRKNDLV